MVGHLSIHGGENNFGLISVLSKASKEGITVTEKKVTEAIQRVMTFFLKGRSDKHGALKEISKSKEVSFIKSLETPDFYTKFEKFVDSRTSEEAVIVSISQFDARFCHKADLVLQSKDFNCCDFTLQLATCLTQDMSTMYLECKDVNRRGLKRLLAILEDIKVLFDRRVRIILVSESTICEELIKLSEHDFGPHKNVNKRARSDDNEVETESCREEELLSAKNSFAVKIAEYNMNLEAKLQEISKLNVELEDLKRNTTQKDLSFESKMLETENQVEKLNILKKGHDSILKETITMKETIDSMKKEISNLLLEKESLELESRQ